MPSLATESRPGDGLAADPGLISEVRRLFAHFDRLNLPQPFEIEYLENVADQFEVLDDFLALVPSRAILQNFATKSLGIRQGRRQPQILSVERFHSGGGLVQRPLHVLHLVAGWAQVS